MTREALQASIEILESALAGHLNAVPVSMLGCEAADALLQDK